MSEPAFVSRLIVTAADGKCFRTQLRRYLPDYHLDMETGQVMHRRHTLPDLSLLSCLNNMSPTLVPMQLDTDPNTSPSTEVGFPTSITQSYHEHLTFKRNSIYDSVCSLTDIEANERRRRLDPEDEKYRPFVMPSEVVDMMRLQHKMERKMGTKPGTMSLEDRWVSERRIIISQQPPPNLSSHPSDRPSRYQHRPYNLPLSQRSFLRS